MKEDLIRRVARFIDPEPGLAANQLAVHLVGLLEQVDSRQRQVLLASHFERLAGDLRRNAGEYHR